MDEVFFMFMFYFQLHRFLALSGAEVIISIAACCQDYVPKIFTRVRAAENLCFAFYCNRACTDNFEGEGGINAQFCGHSIACGPDGEALVLLRMS